MKFLNDVMITIDSNEPKYIYGALPFACTNRRKGYSTSNNRKTNCLLTPSGKTGQLFVNPPSQTISPRNFRNPCLSVRYGIVLLAKQQSIRSSFDVYSLMILFLGPSQVRTVMLMNNRPNRQILL